jgi:hypothetical protein
LSDFSAQIFTSDDVELPRKAVADYLEGISPGLCAHYLEFLIAERQEESALFHDRLADLYLSMTVAAKKRGDQSSLVYLLFASTFTYFRSVLSSSYKE